MPPPPQQKRMEIIKMKLLNKPATLIVEDGTTVVTVTVRGVQCEESADILLRLDNSGVEELTKICGFPICHVLMVSEDGINCMLFVESDEMDNIPPWEDGNNYSQVFTIQNELEALGLYTMAQAM